MDDGSRTSSLYGCIYAVFRTLVDYPKTQFDGHPLRQSIRSSAPAARAASTPATSPAFTASNSPSAWATNEPMDAHTESDATKSLASLVTPLSASSRRAIPRAILTQSDATILR